MLRTVVSFAAACCMVCGGVAEEAVLRSGRVTVAIAPDAAKSVQFAAKEMSGLLGQVLGCEIPVGHDLSGDGTAIVLGTNAWSDAAGLSIDGLPRDAFRVKVMKDRIYIAGADDPAADIEKLVAANKHWALAGCEHATLYGVYDFLERFAGCGFYFPGEIGTVTPRADEIPVPVGDYEQAPVFTVRDIYIGQKFDWPEAVTPSSNYALNWLRLRLQTENIPCSHGSRHFRYIERFAKTHPEYLALKKDGSRWNDPKVFAAYQLCWSDPGLRETMYQDVKAYLTGQPAASRGLERWGVNCVRGKYVDIMPDDSFQGCLCPRCQAAYDVSGPKSGYATKLLWGLTAEIGNRLIKEGVPGNITMMAYTPYRTLPDFALPTNVHVMVAENGPWSVPNESRVKAEADEIAGWADKIGHKVWIWTYPRRGEAVRLPGVPSMAPRAHAAYFKRVAKDIFGSFVESESERFIYHYLNYWMFAKLAWDTDLDVDKALDGHYAKMFGAAATEMKRFYADLEKKWMQMVGNTVDTPLGPVAKAPPVHEVYTRLYSPAVLAEWRKLFDVAEGKVAVDAGSLKRVRFMRAQLLDELDRAVSAYDDATSAAKNLAKREGRPDRSVIRGGEFDSLDGWEVEKGTVSATLDRTTFVTPPASVKIVSDKRAGLKIRIPGVLKPNVKYRVSFFLKTEDVSPAGGAFVEFGLCKDWLYFPGYGKVPPSGTVDWLYQSYEFTAPPGADADREAYFHLLLTSAGTAWYDGLRVEEIETGVTFAPGRSEVVVASDAPKTVRFAADEATNFLSRVLGAPVPVVSAPSGKGIASLVLGECALAKAAGVSVADRGRDSFVIAAKGDRVYIVGRDDPVFDIRANLRNGDGHGPLFVPGCERATLLGVYDFLERDVGCRFYFPDELGEIVPHKDAVTVPEGVRTVTPSFLVRNPYFGGDGRWFNETDAGRGRARIKSLEWLRLRMSTMDIPCCHGSQRFRYIERFAKTRPDFLALKQNGDRYDDPTVFAAHQYCWSNPDFQEALYQDVKAYLMGQPAASRDLARWGVNCRGRYVDIMPDDSFQGCWCARCQAAYRREKGPHYATELIWGVTAKIAQRLQDEGVEGQICQMAYLPYGRVPDFSLPTNVHCMVADTGPWAMAKPDLLADGEARIRAWAAKLGHKIWIWTYPHKFGQTAIDGLPSMGPRAWGAYYKRMAPWIFGAFAECESERAFHNHLNYYVFSHVCWDSATDVESVIDEYHRLMFGAAAPEMKAFYDTLETNWVYRVTGRLAETELGPVASPPSARELWTEIYSPIERARIERLFDAGLAKVPAGSLEARRLALVRRELFEPLEAAAAKWERKAATVESDVYDARLGLPLLATVNTHGKTRGRPPQTRTEIRVWRTPTDFAVEWNCEEPEMDKVKCIERPDDDKDMWLENGVECWINPSDDGRTVYHLILTSKGSLFDRKCLFDGLRAQGDVSWSSRAKRHVERTEKGWKARLEIPLASLPWIKNRFRANFCRDRNVEGCSEYVQTSRFAEAGYNDFENYGTIIVPEAPAAQGDVTFVPGRSEVVVATNAPKTVRFAACEATNFLARILGAPVPIVNAPSGQGVSSLVLGENEWSRAAGVTFDTERRDAFAIAAKGNRVYVVGRDDPKADPFRIVKAGNFWLMRFERATLFGLYEFFERYAGCRFFFPGEYGTVLPKSDTVRVPVGTIRCAPVFTSRNPYVGGDGLWYENHASPKAPCPGKALDWMRLRLETENAPCCHGSRNFRYIERFAKTHPEYLALKKDGSRWDDPKVFAAYQLCWSNPGLRETMYQDVKAYLTGQPAASRGLDRWGVNCVGGMYVDIMPEDSFQGCWCADCQAAYDRTKKHYADGLIWNFTANLANRLKAEGVPGTITQMAYMPYGDVPETELPDNVLVIVAQPGPWSMAKPGKVDEEVALFKAWQEKTGRRVQTWTYPHKFGPTAIPGVPNVAPRAFGAYWKRVAPYVCGGFLESESERAIYSYLNYYIFSKVAWDPPVDVNALLADHNRKMFGAGADEMDEFFRILEEKWIRSIVGNVVNTALGPVARVPPEYEIWTRVYSPSVLRGLAENCERAAQAAGEGSDEARRVAFIRNQFLDPLLAESKRYLDLVSVEQEQARRRAAGVLANLVPEADFSEDNGRGGFRAWSSIRRDTKTFVSAPSSGRLSHTNRLYAIRYFRNGELKPDTRYRISYFLKLKDVKKRGRPQTGVHMAFSDGMTETRFPSGSALDGTIDWIHQSFEVKTCSDVEKLKKGLVCLRLMDASGTVWIDDVQITEIE